MTFSIFSGTVNSFNSFLFIFNTIVPYLKKRSFRCNKFCTSNIHVGCNNCAFNDSLKTSLKNKIDSDILSQLWFLSKNDFKVINYNYETFLKALFNYVDWCKVNKFDPIHIQYNDNYWAFLLGDINNLFPLDHNFLKTKVKKVSGYKKERSKYVKNNATIKNKIKCTDNLDWRKFKKFNKDKGKYHNQKKWKKFMKDTGNKKFRRINNHFMKENKYEKCHTKINEVIDIWSFD